MRCWRCAAPAAQAQEGSLLERLPVVDLSDRSARVDLRESMALLDDPDRDLGAMQVLGGDMLASWQLPGSEGHARWWKRGMDLFSDSYSTTWFALRARVVGEGDVGRALSTDNLWVCELDVYSFDEGRLTPLVHAGLDRPVSDGMIAHRYLSFPVPVSRDGSSVLLIRVTNEVNNMNLFHWQGWSEPLLRRAGLRECVLFVALSALLFSLALYQLAAFVSARSASYLQLSLGLGCIAWMDCWYSGVLQYVLLDGHAPWLRGWMAFAPLFVGVGVMSIFTLNMLEARRFTPRPARLCYVAARCLVAVGLVTPFLPVFFPMMVGILVASVGCTVPSSWVYWRCWQQGDRAARFCIGGFAFAIVGVSIYVPSAPVFTDSPSLLGQTAMGWGIAGMGLFFYLALGERARRDRDERLAAQHEALAVKEEAAATLRAKVAERTYALAASMEKLERLFDSLGQGVFSFGPDGVIQGDCSQAARSILQQDELTGVPVRDLLLAPMSDADPEKGVLDSFLGAVFRAAPEDFSELAMLAPREIVLGPDSDSPRHLRLEFRPVLHGAQLQQVMCLVTDVTDLRSVEAESERLEAESRAQINMLRNISIGGASELVRFLRHAEDGWSELEALFGARPRRMTLAELDEVFQLAHTLKGDARLHDLLGCEQAAADIEDLLDDLRRFAQREGAADDTTVHGRFGVLIARARTNLRDTRQMIVDAAPMGEAALEQVTVSQPLLDRLVEAAGTEDRGAGWVTLVQQLAARPFHELVARLQRAVPGWASQRGKQAALTVSGGEVGVPCQLADALTSALTHLVRNSVVHGLETSSERAREGKRGEGHIELRCTSLPGGVRVELQDDGCGIDLAGLRARLSPDAGEVSDEELPFVAGVSTAEETDAMAGRGMGMVAGRHELQQVGYGLRVAQAQGSGVHIVIEPLPARGAPGSGVSAA